MPIGVIMTLFGSNFSFESSAEPAFGSFTAAAIGQPKPERPVFSEFSDLNHVSIRISCRPHPSYFTSQQQQTIWGDGPKCRDSNQQIWPFVIQRFLLYQPKSIWRRPTTIGHIKADAFTMFESFINPTLIPPNTATTTTTATTLVPVSLNDCCLRLDMHPLQPNTHFKDSDLLDSIDVEWRDICFDWERSKFVKRAHFTLDWPLPTSARGISVAAKRMPAEWNELEREWSINANQKKKNLNTGTLVNVGNASTTTTTSSAIQSIRQPQKRARPRQPRIWPRPRPQPPQRPQSEVSSFVSSLWKALPAIWNPSNPRYQYPTLCYYAYVHVLHHDSGQFRYATDEMGIPILLWKDLPIWAIKVWCRQHFSRPFHHYVSCLPSRVRVCIGNGGYGLG